MLSRTCVRYREGNNPSIICPCNPFIHSLFAHVSIIFRNIHHQEQLWEISINIIKEWLSRSLLVKYGPSMGFEEEVESQQLIKSSSNEDINETAGRNSRVTIAEGEEGTPMITFRVTKGDNEEVNESPP